MNKFAYKSDVLSPQLYCCATRAWGATRKALAPVPWLMRAAFGARTPIAEFMPRLRETSLEARFPSPNPDMTEGNVAGSARLCRRKNIYTWLEEATLEALVPAVGTTP